MLAAVDLDFNEFLYAIALKFRWTVFILNVIIMLLIHKLYQMRFIMTSLSSGVNSSVELSFHDTEVLRMIREGEAKSSFDLYEILIMQGKHVTLSDAMDDWARLSQKAIESVSNANPVTLPQVRSPSCAISSQNSSQGAKNAVDSIIDEIMTRRISKSTVQEPKASLEHQSVQDILYLLEKGVFEIEDDAYQIANDFVELKSIEGSVSYAQNYLGSDEFMPDNAYKVPQLYAKISKAIGSVLVMESEVVEYLIKHIRPTRPTEQLQEEIH